ncbi:MAG: MFS transporter [Bryobacteraceae bacterium]
MTPQASAVAVEAQAQRVSRPLFMLALFCVAHLFVDLYSMALSAMQPVLIDRFRMTLTQAGFLSGLMVFASSVMQPLYGYLSDRFHTRMFTVLAPAVAAVFISSLGLAPAYWALIPMVFLGGAGVASFHPQATANATAGFEYRQRFMAIFISAGTVGLSLGPTYFSLAIKNLGFTNTWVAAIPGVIVSIFLFWYLKFSPSRSASESRFDLGALRFVWKPMTIHYFLVFLRSVVQVTFAQLMPLYLHIQRGYPTMEASYFTTLYMFAGALGGFIGGNLADGFGGRRIILISMLGCVPFLLLFVLTEGWISIAGLVLGASILLFTIPVNVTMAQELAPKQAGTVSALMMGFSWGMAGMIFIPLTGWVSDHFSMQHAFTGLVMFPLIGFFLALKLKR